jgi:hypothetical protein
VRSERIVRGRWDERYRFPKRLKKPDPKRPFVIEFFEAAKVQGDGKWEAGSLASSGEHLLASVPEWRRQQRLTSWNQWGRKFGKRRPPRGPSTVEIPELYTLKQAMQRGAKYKALFPKKGDIPSSACGT